ncbi:hypothetical protein ZIOFF_054204 [Zingiber officinale]|uniref:Deoxyuridine 5'-triphosphate nucleotidohydrolase n=1 Tax=Zingiber officinale TaxID=94328 RepID=A0A8J5FDN3_ZINOF|nr:hypothetical protein ZIOFF_054204 [Zingiber officinale]
MSRRLAGGSAPAHTLEQQIDPQEQLRLSMQERAALVPAEVLYHSRQDDAHHQVYIHRSEEAILVTEGNQIDRTFIQEGSFNQLQRSRMQYIHIGVPQGEYPFILVHKLSPNAILPQRKTSGAAGIDLAANQLCVIPTRGRGKIHTSISMEIPWGCYERIATRSSATWNLGLDIGAGVIDSDYRGEIIILAFNHSDVPVRISPRQCVAQLIIENISLPEVYEAPQLSTTVRGQGGFGSTSNQTSTSAIFDKLLPQGEAYRICDCGRRNSQGKSGTGHAGDTSLGPVL